jgi:hypothetical protein
VTSELISGWCVPRCPFGMTRNVTTLVIGTREAASGGRAMLTHSSRRSGSVCGQWLSFGVNGHLAVVHAWLERWLHVSAGQGAVARRLSAAVRAQCLTRPKRGLSVPRWDLSGTHVVQTTSSDPMHRMSDATSITLCGKAWGSNTTRYLTFDFNLATGAEQVQIAEIEVHPLASSTR